MLADARSESCRNRQARAGIRIELSLLLSGHLQRVEHGHQVLHNRVERVAGRGPPFVERNENALDDGLEPGGPGSVPAATRWTVTFQALLRDQCFDVAAASSGATVSPGH